MARTSKRIVAGATVVAGLIFAIGCGKKDEVPVPPKTVAQMAGAQVMQRGFHPPVGHARKDTSGAAITVDVALADSAIIVDPTHPPAAETILAEITNTGPQPEWVYKFLPSTQATYYLYAEPSLDPTSHTTAYKITQVMSGGATTVFKSGGFHDCNDHHTSPNPHVGFKKCGVAGVGSLPMSQRKVNEAGMFGTNIVSRLLRGMFALIQPNDTTGRDPTDPAWVACSDGCCTVNAS